MFIGMVDVGPKMPQRRTALMDTNCVQSVSNLNVRRTSIDAEMNGSAVTCFKEASSYSCFSSCWTRRISSRSSRKRQTPAVRSEWLLRFSCLRAHFASISVSQVGSVFWINCKSVLEMYEGRMGAIGGGGRARVDAVWSEKMESDLKGTDSKLSPGARANLFGIVGFNRTPVEYS